MKATRTLLAIAALGAALWAAPGARAQSAAVGVGDNVFQPKTMTVPVGTTVTWTHTGQRPHTVTADDNSFDSHPACAGGTGCMQNGQTFSRTFEVPGTFAYFCKIHGGPNGAGMSGTIVVQAPDPTPAPAQPEPPAQNQSPAYEAQQPRYAPAPPPPAKPAAPVVTTYNPPAATPEPVVEAPAPEAQVVAAPQPEAQAVSADDGGPSPAAFALGLLLVVVAFLGGALLLGRRGPA